MKRAIFIDRDGTLVVETPTDETHVSVENLQFLPGAISGMKVLAGLDYELVLASNQDGLGTEIYPEEIFWDSHRLILSVLASEGIYFDDQLIDPTMPEAGAPTRKPGIGMFGKYLGSGGGGEVGPKDGDGSRRGSGSDRSRGSSGGGCEADGEVDGWCGCNGGSNCCDSDSYDMSKSFVIGDRITDIILARNLGAKGILIKPREIGARMVADEGLEDVCALITNDWSEIAEFLRLGSRTATVRRTTRETDITVSIDLDGRPLKNILITPSGDDPQNNGPAIDTGLKFLDHMLDQIAHHSGMSLSIRAIGDLEVDEHHTMEDVAITLGEALIKALGDRKGVERYGFALPMDESKALVLIDLGGRIDFEWSVDFKRERVGDVPTEMFSHFFKSLGAAMRCGLHIAARGENDHHVAEGIFKAFARALKAAVKRDIFNDQLPTSKGVI